MRAQFVFSEIGIGLKRNLTMTIALVIVMTISLVMVGAAWLVRAQVNEMKDYWYDKVEVTVFLCGGNSTSPNCGRKDVTQEQRNQIQTALQSTPQVKEVFYESKADAFQRFKEQFKDSPDLVNNVSDDALPESFRVKLKNPEQFAVVASAFQDQPGVDSVQDLKKLLKPFFDLLGLAQLASLIIAGIMLFAATLLISITIRVAAHSRRRETGIMRLVGASNLYIQLPFLLEGALAGVASAILASGVLAACKVGFDAVVAPKLKFTEIIDWGPVLGVTPLLLLIAVVLSSAASFFTLRRYLRV